MEDKVQVDLSLKYPTKAKIDPKIKKMPSSTEIDPWNLVPVELAETRATVYKDIGFEIYQPSLEFPNLVEPEKVPGQLPDEWGSHLYLPPTTDFEADILEQKLDRRRLADQLVYQMGSKTKTRTHPLQPKNFDFSNYKMDEMIPFHLEDIASIVETLISNAKVDWHYEVLLAPANGLFLLARYANYIQANELLRTLLNLALHTCGNLVRNKANDLTASSFWLTNLNQLLYYLKKDSGLGVASIEQQVLIPELMYEAYLNLVNGVNSQTGRLLTKSMLDHEISLGIETKLEMAAKDKRSRRHTKTRSLSPRQQPYSPRTITTVLASIHYLLDQYWVHPALVSRVLSQSYFFLATTLFNEVMTNPSQCTRSKALQLRMNVSNLEEWARVNLPQNFASLNAHFRPLIQLLELLQCVTQLTNLKSFLDTIELWDSLNANHIDKVISQYQYERDENPIQNDVSTLVKFYKVHQPNHRIPKDADKTMRVDKLIKSGAATSDAKNRDSGMKNPTHILPFGTPNSVEMESWVGDYTPFLPPDLQIRLKGSGNGTIDGESGF